MVSNPSQKFTVEMDKSDQIVPPFEKKGEMKVSLCKGRFRGIFNPAPAILDFGWFDFAHHRF